MNDKGEGTNLHIGKSSIEDFVNKLKQNTDPVLYPSINIKTFALGEIVEIDVQASDYKPVFAFNKAFMRAGKSSVVLSANEIRSLVKKYNLPDFDTQFTDKQHSIDKQLAQKVNYFTGSKLMIGEYLCLADGELNQMNFHAKAGLFKGNNMTTVLDMKDFKHNLIKQSEELLEYVKRQINMEVIITGASKRSELWDYPLGALVNALTMPWYTETITIMEMFRFGYLIKRWKYGVPGFCPKKLI